MSVDDLIRLVAARLASLNSLRATAASLGDLAQVMRLDQDVVQTQATLDQLKTLVAANV